MNRTPRTADTIRLAAVQAAPVWLDRAATVAKACDLIAEAGGNGARVIGFPENFIPGHPVWYYYHPATSEASMDLAVRLFNNSVEIPSDEVDALCAAAARARTFVVMGLTERRPDTTGTLYNTQLFIGPDGRIIGKHHKLVPTVGERLVHAPGSPDAEPLVPSDIGPLSGLCCGENANPFALAYLAAGYPWIHVASWPNHGIPHATNQPASLREISVQVSRSVAYIVKCYVISSVSVNGADMIESVAATPEDAAFMRDSEMTGGATIIDPRGVVVAGPAPGDQETILYADADRDLAVRARLVHDFGGHYNRSDVYRLQVARQPVGLVEHHASAVTDQLAAAAEASTLEIGPGRDGRKGDALLTLPLPDGGAGRLR